jgi:DTW domain-containing protein YfiP
MSRLMCYRCFWPQSLCWCGSIHPIATRTRFVFLMHPKEFKEEKAGTGRLTHLCLANSEIHVGTTFDRHENVQALLRDPENFPVLLYPGENARNLSRGDLSSTELGGRRLVVLLLDATWSGARKMLKLSPCLQQLPRVMFTPGAPSRYVIKQQPQEGCLSTLEATHELLTALAHSGLDQYARPEQLLELFRRMQDFQIKCASDPNRIGYRKKPYTAPSERHPASGRSGSRRRRYLRTPPAADTESALSV